MEIIFSCGVVFFFFRCHMGLLNNYMYTLYDSETAYFINQKLPDRNGNGLRSDPAMVRQKSD